MFRAMIFLFRKRFHTLFLATAFFSNLYCSDPLFDAAADGGSYRSNQLFFLIQNGEVGRAIDLYREIVNRGGEHDYQLLQDIGLSLLEIGSVSHDPEVQLLSLFGAGVSLNEKSLHILERGMRSNNPQHQVVSLNFLTRYHNDDALRVIESAMRSDFLPIRLEAAFHLCLTKHAHATAQAESLMNKLPPEAQELFPQFFAASATPTAIRILKKMLNNQRAGVRIQAIGSAVKFRCEETLSVIRMLATHHDVAQQEACAYALGEFGDETSIPRLRKLSLSKSLPVRLAASRSLYRMGDKKAKQNIIDEALKGDVFAIALLGELPDSEELLYPLTNADNIHVRINASYALLQKRDSRALKPLLELLIQDVRDLGLSEVSTVGGSLRALKAIPSATQNFKDKPVNKELSLSKREELLIMAAELPQNDFLALANALFAYEQNDLVPVLVKLLENIQSEEAIALLKGYSQKVGAPLIRNYCNLALYRLDEKGPYYENLKSWILSKQSVDLLRLRPFVPLEKRAGQMQYQMTPEEESRLLIESFESFVQMQDDRGIAVLLQAIREGNKNNKYVLAGLLIRATL